MSNDAAYLLGIILTVAEDHPQKCRCLACRLSYLTQANLGYLDVINPYELVKSAKEFRWPAKEYR